jgi:acetyl esterase/lipase
MLDLDPDVLEQVSVFADFTLDSETLSVTRSFDFAVAVELSHAVERTDQIVPGDPDVLIRIHGPAGAEGDLPCVYSIHGGGYVIGSFTMDDPLFDAWCPKFGCVGVSVEYRLAPETPFPGPLEDCYLGLKWVYEHAGELQIDPAQIGVHGTSAGGGLAAALALLARDRGEIPLRYQLLDCPMLDDRQTTPSSQLDDLYVWNRDSNAFGWRSYLGDLYGTPSVPAYAAAARATNLAGLPPAYVCVGAVDGFRDEDVEYATRLNQAGVPTELHVVPGAPHGIAMFPDTDVAKRYPGGIEDWLGRQIPTARGRITSD